MQCIITFARNYLLLNFLFLELMSSSCNLFVIYAPIAWVCYFLIKKFILNNLISYAAAGNTTTTRCADVLIRFSGATVRKTRQPSASTGRGHSWRANRARATGMRRVVRPALQPVPLPGPGRRALSQIDPIGLAGGMNT